MPLRESNQDATPAVELAPRPAAALDAIERLVLDAVSSPKTKALYGQALREFLSWIAVEQPGPLSKARRPALSHGAGKQGAVGLQRQRPHGYDP